MSTNSAPCHLFHNNNFETVKNILNKHKTWNLFLDYDGTLAPFKEKPTRAYPLPGIKQILKELSLKKYINLIFISGRRLFDLKKKIDIEKAYYAGLHGLEMNKYSSPNVIDEKIIDKLKDKIKSSGRFNKIRFEDKGGVLSIHHPKNYSNKKLLINFLNKQLTSNNYQILEGRQVIEIKPEGWNKGKAVKQFLKEIVKKGLSIYIGDDTTDEDAFKELNKYSDSISIYVKNEADLNSRAKYYLNNPSQVKEFLNLILYYKNNNPL